jgi:hypothetical protein
MKQSLLKTYEFRKLIKLVIIFMLLGLLFYFVKLGQWSWDILLAGALIWCAIEVNRNKSKYSLYNAIKIGAFLLIFDFIFENTGWIFGLWQTFSTVYVGVVPIQVMGIAFFGGIAWALYLPKRFSFWHSFPDALVFGLFGALGEWLLIQQGLFVYKLWWTSIFAFFSYFLTWCLLHFIRYNVFKDKNAK